MYNTIYYVDVYRIIRLWLETITPGHSVMLQVGIDDGRVIEPLDRSDTDVRSPSLPLTSSKFIFVNERRYSEIEIKLKYVMCSDFKTPSEIKHFIRPRTEQHEYDCVQCRA